MSGVPVPAATPMQKAPHPESADPDTIHSAQTAEFFLPSDSATPLRSALAFYSNS